MCSPCDTFRRLFHCGNARSNLVRNNITNGSILYRNKIKSKAIRYVSHVRIFRECPSDNYGRCVPLIVCREDYRSLNTFSTKAKEFTKSLKAVEFQHVARCSRAAHATPAPVVSRGRKTQPSPTRHRRHSRQPNHRREAHHAQQRIGYPSTTFETYPVSSSAVPGAAAAVKAAAAAACATALRASTVFESATAEITDAAAAALAAVLIAALDSPIPVAPEPPFPRAAALLSPAPGGKGGWVTAPPA